MVDVPQPGGDIVGNDAIYGVVTPRQQHQDDPGESQYSVKPVKEPPPSGGVLLNDEVPDDQHTRVPREYVVPTERVLAVDTQSKPRQQLQRPSDGNDEARVV